MRTYLNAECKYISHHHHHHHHKRRDYRGV